MPIARAFLLLLFALAACVMSGCNIIGAAATIVAPPELVDARYELPDKPTLIVIDDPAGMVNSSAILRQIAANTQAALETEEVVTAGVVGQDRLAAYRDELGDAYRETSLAGLALHLEARQVIHAEVVDYQMNMAGNVIRPSITLSVKVFDLDERDRVFPATDGAFVGETPNAPTYILQTRLHAQDVSGRSAQRNIMARELANDAGRDLGRLFFDWRKPPPGAELGER